MYARYKRTVTKVKSQEPSLQNKNDKELQGSDKTESDPKEDFVQKNRHLKETFLSIDEFFKTLTENPTLDGFNYEEFFTSIRFQLLLLGEADRNLLGDYFALVEGARAIKSSYETLLRSLGVSCMAEISPEMKEKNPECVAKMNNLRELIIFNAYSSFGEQLCSEGLLRIFVDDLKLINVEDIKNGNLEQYNFFDTIVSGLHNYLTNPAARQPLREYDTVKVLLPFLKCESREKLLTVCTLAKLVDETENEHLLADDTVFDILFEQLNSALNNPSHIAHGWTLRALIKGMAGLAKNDSNKTVLYEKGAVLILIRVLKDGNHVEKERAAGCIWELAFDKTIKEAFAENEELVSLLKDLTVSPKESIAKAAKGALWEIQQGERAQQHSTQALDGNELDGGHVMISYQWADQAMLLKIKDSLNEHGYKVWMDVVNMSESTLEAMAKAVEDAAVVLVCMSERYKLSQNCRSEAEYAFSLKKKIVPLIMQRNYTPDGWLGMIKGTKLFFDFSGKYQYNDKIEGLIRELGQSGKQVIQTIDGAEVPVVSLTQSWKMDSTRGSKLVSSWTQKDVHKWLSKIGLQQKSSLQELSGENLVFLQDLSHKAPEYYCNYLETKLGLTSLNDMMAFSRAIDKL